LLGIEGDHPMGILNVHACAAVRPHNPISIGGAEPTDGYELTLLISDAASGQPRDGVGPDDVELISLGSSPTSILSMSGFSSILSQHGLYSLFVGGVNPMRNDVDCVGVFVTSGGDRGQTLYRVDITGRPVHHPDF
jgi:hypothetical protein